MNATRSIVSMFAAIALSAIAAGCTEHTPPPPSSPSIPNPPPTVPAPPSTNPMPPNTPNINPTVPPGSPPQSNPSPDAAKQ